jgi:hypothetical protein
MTKEAYEWGEAWYVENERNPPPQLIGERYEGVIARRQTMLHKLALVLQASHSDELVITPKVLNAAASVLHSVEAQLPVIFNKVGMSINARTVNSVTAEVRRRGMIQRKHLAKVLTQLSPRELIEAINEGVQIGDVQEQIVGNVLYLKYVGEPENAQPPVNVSSTSE